MRVDTSLDSEIVRLYKTLSLSGVARTLGERGKPIGTTRVRNALIRNGVRLRKRGGTHHFLPQDEVRRTVLLYQHGGPGRLGMTMKEVGRVLGVASGTVWDRLRQAGVPGRSRAEHAELMRSRRTLAAGTTGIRFLST